LKIPLAIAEHCSYIESTKEGDDIMSNAPHPLIAAALAMPKTHAIITKYADGKEYRFETRNLASAENYAVGQRRKIGRDLIDRETGNTVRVISVDIVRI
jgi:hypothetical protein